MKTLADSILATPCCDEAANKPYPDQRTAYCAGHCDALSAAAVAATTHEAQYTLPAGSSINTPRFRARLGYIAMLGSLLTTRGRRAYKALVADIDRWAARNLNATEVEVEAGQRPMKSEAEVRQAFEALVAPMDFESGNDIFSDHHDGKAWNELVAGEYDSPVLRDLWAVYRATHLPRRAP